jgi:hypothetical protein
MNYSEHNKTAEIFSILHHLNANCDTVQKIPLLQQITCELAILLKNMEQCNRNQINHQNGWTKLNQEEKRKISEAAVCIASGVEALASAQGNRALKNAVKYSFSDFYRPVPKTTIGRCRQVLNAAQKISNPLHIGFSHSKLQNFEEEINKYNSHIIKFTESQKLKIRSTNEFKKHLAEAMKLLRTKMDPLMRLLKIEHRNLSNIYFFNRNKKQPGRKKHYSKRQPTLTIPRKSVNIIKLAEKIIASNEKKKLAIELETAKTISFA